MERVVRKVVSIFQVIRLCLIWAHRNRLRDLLAGSLLRNELNYVGNNIGKMHI